MRRQKRSSIFFFNHNVKSLSISPDSLLVRSVTTTKHGKVENKGRLEKEKFKILIAAFAFVFIIIISPTIYAFNTVVVQLLTNRRREESRVRCRKILIFTFQSTHWKSFRKQEMMPILHFNQILQILFFFTSIASKNAAGKEYGTPLDWILARNKLFSLPAENETK